MRVGQGGLRRMWGSVLAVVLVLGASGCWWTQQGFGPGRTYANGGEQRLTAETVGGVVRLWDGVDLGQALVAGDTIYAVEGGQVTAYGARTGAVRWRHFLSTSSTGPPLLADGVLYVPSHDVREVCDPTIPACFNSVSNVGVRRFTASTGAPLAPIDWPQGSAVPVGPPGATGRYLATGRGFVPPRFDPTPLFDSYWTHDLTGTTPDAVFAPASQADLLPPEIDEARDQVVVGGSSSVEAFALGCDGCPPRWTAPVGATALAASGDAGDAVVLATGTGEVRLLDAATGAQRAEGLVDFGSASLAVASQGAIVVRAPQRLWVFDGCTNPACPPSWRSSVRAFGQPVIAGDLVYVNGAPGPDAPGSATLDVYRLDGCGQPTCAPVVRLPALAGAAGAVVSGGLIVTQQAVFGLP